MGSFLFSNVEFVFMSKLLRFDVLFRFPLSSSLCAQREAKTFSIRFFSMYYLWIWHQKFDTETTETNLIGDLNYSCNKPKFSEIKTLKVVLKVFQVSSSFERKLKFETFLIWNVDASRGDVNVWKSFLKLKRNDIEAQNVSRLIAFQVIYSGLRRKDVKRSLKYPR